jgi:hypothetical protein
MKQFKIKTFCFISKQFVAASLGRGNKHFDPKTKRFGSKQFHNPVRVMKQFKIKTLSFDFKQFYKWHTVPFIKQFDPKQFVMSNRKNV